MKIPPFRFLLCALGLAAVLALLQLGLSAQTAPFSSTPTSPYNSTPTAPYSAPTSPVSTSSLASMQEDISALQREVGSLHLQVESLQQENDELKKKVPSSETIKSLVQNLIAASRADTAKDIAAANAESRKDILADVAKQLEALAKETNVQLKELAKAIGNAPAPHPVSVTTAPPPHFDKGIDYVVKSGDSFAKICSANHVSSRDLLAANPQLNGNANQIRVGQHLFIPQKEGAPAAGPGLTSLPPATTGN